MNKALLKRTLRSIYDADFSHQIERYVNLYDFAGNSTATDDPLIIRAPGRVNLIGEHTDYNGYPVLPMAVNRDIAVTAVPTANGKIEIYNTNKHFASVSFSIEHPIRADKSGSWSNYIKAAIKALLKDRANPIGFRAWIDGNIPPAAGLSSSSALVVAAALTFLKINDLTFESLALAERLAKAERFVGTAGGGMDQAVSLLGKKDHAVKIDFFPLRAKTLPLPDDYKIVICHSLISAPKTESARRQYNRRPIECKLATALIAQHLKQAAYPLTHLPARLADVDNRHFNLNAGRYQELVDKALSPAAMDWNMICQRLGMSEKEIGKKWSIPQEWIEEPPPEGFKCLQRYGHVISEAERVQQAGNALERGNADQFGALMFASHQSCRDLYEISTPELDALVDIGRRAGAIGARLTGAGFGGCTVNLVHKAKIKMFIDHLLKAYYQDYLPKQRPDVAVNTLDSENIIFTSAAMPGAGMIGASDA